MPCYNLKYMELANFTEFKLLAVVRTGNICCSALTTLTLAILICMLTSHVLYILNYN
jgi:hypothetical protein